MGAVEAVDEVRRGRAARERQPVADDHGLFTGGIGRRRDVASGRGDLVV